MTVSPVIVLPAPPHPTARNTAARYYAALVAGLSAQGIAPRVLAVDDGSGETAQEWTAGLPGVALELFAPELVRRDPLTRLRRFARPMFDAVPAKLVTRLDEHLENGYDVLHVEEFHIGRLASSRPRSVLSVLHSEARDARARPSEDLRTRLRVARGLRAERMILRDQTHLRTLSKELERDLREAGADAPIDVIPLSLDLNRYLFRPSGRSDTVGLIGSMQWPTTRASTLRLLRSIWPAVLKQRPEAELVIAGWGADSLSEEAIHAGRVNVLSDVSDHREFFDRIGILAFPLQVGSGMKVKVLEAMAMGVAVVTTRAGTEGLTNAENAVWYGGTDSDFATSIVAALDDASERDTRARRARDLLAQQCAPNVVAAQLTGLYQRIRRKEDGRRLASNDRLN